MREILFKAKRKDNGEWVEGYFVKLLKDMCYIIDKDTFSHYLVDENTLCQYTGLTDKNGNKIWENDVVRDNVIHGTITWDVENGRFVVDDINDDYQDYSDWWGEVEVIGNTFDNPELLGG